MSALLGCVGPASAQPFGFTRSMLPPDTEVSSTVALADFDGDGDLDAFVGNGDPLTVALVPRPSRLYRNEGAGVFADVSASGLPPLVDLTTAVAVGDLDQDGDLDAFVGNWGQSRLYFNEGTGVFVEASGATFPVTLESTVAVAVGDLDGDGDLDAFVGNAMHPNRLYRNLGSGLFIEVGFWTLPLTYARAVDLGDVDADGDLDAFLAYPGRLLRNDGTGAFTDVTATNLPPVPSGTNAVSLGDVDGDGDLDAFLGTDAVGYSPYLPDRLHLNDGAGDFSDVSAANLPVVLDVTRAVALGDVDGDGDLDAFAGNDGGPSRLYANGGAGTFADVTGTNFPLLPDRTRALALGDVDGDGDLDAFAGNLAGQDRLYLNDGAGAFADATMGGIPPAAADGTAAVVLGDLDGDGDLDAFLGNSSTPNRVFRNQGSGAFTDLGFPVSSARGVGLGDVDADGDLDAMTGSYFSQPRLFRNDGTGSFLDVTAANVPLVFVQTRAVALGDVDGDGDLDAYLGTSDDVYGLPDLAQDRLFLNGGAGTFLDATATNLPAVSDGTMAASLGDVDGDGDLDAFVGNLGQDRLCLNNGAGVFTDVTATSLPSSGGWTRAVALGDVDGDGDLDAFTGNGGQDRLYVNNGAGLFQNVTATNLPLETDSTLAVGLGDLDEDGDLDAFVGNSGYPSGGQNRLYLNDGAGVFSDATVFPGHLDRTLAVALGDLDGDGDLDAFAGVDGQERVYSNLARQLAWRGIPRAGKPLTLEMWGPANGVWLLAAAPGSASVPLPPFGTFLLDPATTFVVAGGALDPQGRASLTFPVPANSGLVGASLYWQAIVGPPFRFTNLEITTVTGL